MELNQSRVLASDLYLVENWHTRTEPSPERRRPRNAIFHDFVQLGMRGRWAWHARAEKCDFGEFTTEEKSLLECRNWPTRCIAFSISEDLRHVVVVVVVDHAEPLSDADVEFRTDLEGDCGRVCRYGESTFKVLPEIVYSMSAFDDPDDVEEARRSWKEQSLWISGVFWIGNRIVWVGGFGATVRQKVCDLQDWEAMRDAAQAFEDFRSFESSWWTEAIRMGKYAEDDWWLR